jgi:hypothetical protein
MPTMRDRGWVGAQFIVAGGLLVLSLVGVIGLVVFGAAELTFSFGGVIQAFAVFPGTVISLVVNALIMRSHRDAGLSDTEKVLLALQFCFIFGLVVMHFVNDALGALIIAWPAHIALAIIVFVVALVRATTLRREAATAPASPSD